MCVGSFACANTRHPQAEEAEKQKRKGSKSLYCNYRGVMFKYMTTMNKGLRRYKETSDIRSENKGWPTGPSPGCPGAARTSAATHPTLHRIRSKRLGRG